MKNNKGFSLVEMILVIAILAVLVLVGTLGLSYVQGREAEKATQEIVSVLREAQAISMVKYETQVTITTDASGNIVANTTVQDNADAEKVTETSRICSSTVSILCAAQSPNDSMTFVFDRTNGSFKTFPDTEIYVEKAGTKKVIVIAPGTGKISIE